MTRRNGILVFAALVVVGLAAGLVVRIFFSGPPPGRILVAGDVRSVIRTVSAPSISYPTVTFSVKVLNNSIDTIISNQDKISTGWSKLATGKAKLDTGKQQLATAKATLLKAKAGLLASQSQLLDAKKNRAQLEAQLAAKKQQAATYPPGAVPPKLLGEIAGLEKLLASIDPGLAKISAGLAQVNAGLAKVATGAAALQTGSAALSTAAGKLATASDALRTAKKQVVNARNVTKIIAQNADVPVELAKAKRDLATIVSPVSGWVTQAATNGQVVIVGAPVVRIQQVAPALVDTFVTPEQLAQIHVGSPADVTSDSDGRRVLHASVAIIGADAQYPPTSFPTDVVHMTRTVNLTLRLDSGEAPPPGTPVDISIQTN